MPIKVRTDHYGPGVFGKYLGSSTTTIETPEEGAENAETVLAIALAILAMLPLMAWFMFQIMALLPAVVFCPLIAILGLRPIWRRAHRAATGCVGMFFCVWIGSLPAIPFLSIFTGDFPDDSLKTKLVTGVVLLPLLLLAVWGFWKCLQRTIEAFHRQWEP